MPIRYLLVCYTGYGLISDCFDEAMADLVLTNSKLR